MINDIFFSLVGITGGVIVHGENSFILNDAYEGIISEPDRLLINKVCEIGYNYNLLKDFVNNYIELEQKFHIEEYYKYDKVNKPNKAKKEKGKSKSKSNQKQMKMKKSDLEINLEKENFDVDEKMEKDNMDDDESEEVNQVGDLDLSNFSIYLLIIKEHISEYLTIYEEHVSKIEQEFFNNDYISKTDLLTELSPFNNVFIRVYDFIQFILTNEMKGGDILNFIFTSLQHGDLKIKDFFKDLYIKINIYIFNVLIEFMIEGVLDYTQNEFFIVGNNIKDDDDIESWNMNYFIEKNNVPSFFPISIIESSLFIGKGMKILKNRKNELYSIDQSIDVVSLNSILIESIQYDKQAYIITEYINFHRFEEGVNKIKDIISQELWELFNEKYQFLDQIRVIKDLLLTFNGEFFQNFVCKISSIINTVWDNSKIETDLNEKYFQSSIKEVFLSKKYKNIEAHCEYEKYTKEKYFQPFQSTIEHLSSNEDLNEKEIDEYLKYFFAFKSNTHFDISKIYSNFKIKLFSSGFEVHFKPEFIQNTLNNKDIFFIGNIIHDQQSNMIRFINSVFKKQNSGSLWNLNQYDLDNEFIISLDFTINNYSKKGLNESSQHLLSGGLLSTSNIKDPLRSSQMKRLRQSRSRVMDIDLNSNFNLNNSQSQYNSNNKFSNYKVKEKSNDKSLFLNFLLHTSDNTQANLTNINASSLENLLGFILVQLHIKYDYNRNSRPIELIINIQYKGKENNETLLINSIQYDLIKFSDFSFLCNDVLSNITILYKMSQLIITSKYSKDFKIIIPFEIYNYINKGKSRLHSGVLLSSDNIDVTVDLHYFSTKFTCGDIFNENINLIIIDFLPSFPINFYFHESIRKTYNQIFNLIFPFKCYLTLMNQLWLDKKIFKKIEFSSEFDSFLRNISSIQSEVVLFVNNMISYYMFDIIEPRYNKMIKEIKEKKDFQYLFKLHEEFIYDIQGLTFVKSKKIMRILFEILSIVKRIYIKLSIDGFGIIEKVEKILNRIKFDRQIRMINDERHEREEEGKDLNDIKAEVFEYLKGIYLIKEEFVKKKKLFVSTLLKIKNVKYLNSISLLLNKIDPNYDYFNYAFNEIDFN